jgi:hypothetical protein
MCLDVHVKLSKFKRWLSLQKKFGVDSVCDEIVCLASNEIISAYAQPAHAIIFEKYRKKI